MKMVAIIISETMIQNRIKRIFDYIDEDSNEGSLELRLKQAWYEL